jgi:hypothetical protein
MNCGTGTFEMSQDMFKTYLNVLYLLNISFVHSINYYMSKHISFFLNQIHTKSNAIFFWKRISNIFEIYKFVTNMNLVRLNECGITFKNKALSACQEKNITTIFTKRVLLAVVVSFIWDMLVRKKLFTFSASQEIC